jgi:hypothetical protein
VKGLVGLKQTSVAVAVALAVALALPVAVIASVAMAVALAMVVAAGNTSVAMAVGAAGTLGLLVIALHAPAWGHPAFLLLRRPALLALLAFLFPLGVLLRLQDLWGRDSHPMWTDHVSRERSY